MRAQSKHSRWIALRVAGAIVGIAALAVGLTACGSDSSSGDASTSAVVDKEASLERNMQLTVVNGVPPHPDGESEDWFYVCFYTPEQCTDPSGIEAGFEDGYNIARGKSVTATWDGHLLGRLQYPVGYQYTDITAYNPCCAAPWIELKMLSDVQNGPDGHPALIDSGKWSLSEGESTTVQLSRDNYTLERSADTSDAIVLTLTALGGASSP